MLYPLLLSLAMFGCQGEATSKAPAKPSIEVFDEAANAVLTTVVPGHPCRATVDGVELLVGGPQLVAQVGEDRWSGETAENGTTLRKNEQIVARIHAKQLVDANGLPLIRVLDNGDIVDKSNAVVRSARATPSGVYVDKLLVRNTIDMTLAAFLTAREAPAEVRALAVCNILFEKT